MGFLPAKFELARPFHSQLMVTHGIDREMDRQTIDINTLCPHPMGAGHNNIQTYHKVPHLKIINILLNVKV